MSIAISVGTAAVIGAGASLAGGVIKGVGAAAGGYAQAQASREAIQAQIAERARAIEQAQEVSRMSAGEAKSINTLLTTKESALTSSMQSIQKQQEILNKVDPAVQAAGKNLVDLLTGKAADMLKPIQVQRDRQRRQLESQLSSQLGPGFMTSSAGIQALTRFDQETSMLSADAQQKAISNITNTYSNLFGQQQQGQNAITSQTQGAFGQAMNADLAVLSANQTVQNRMTGATLNAMSANPIGYGEQAKYAGAGLADAGSAFGETLGNFGAGLMGTAGYYFGNKAGSAAGSNLVSSMSNNIPSASNFGQTIASAPGFAIGKAS